MNKLPLNIVQFASGNTDVLAKYEGMKDYYFHYMSEVAGKRLGAYDSSVSLAEKEQKMHKALLSEISRVSGQAKPQEMSFEVWSTNPMVKWATFAVVGMMIDAIIPDTIIKNIGIYADIKPVPYGQTLEIDIAPNSLFTVSEGANAQRHAFVQKQFKTTKTIVPVNHTVTVEIALYKVLCGEESLAEFTRKAVIAMETQMTGDAYDALNAVVDGGTFPEQLKKTGYSVKDLITLCQITEAYNQGNKPTIIGTTQALYNILPDSAKGYRIVTNSESAGIQLIKNFFDYDIMVLPQVATGRDFGLRMKDDRVYVMSTGVDKIIKGAVEGQTLTNTDETYANANLTQKATMNKRWDFQAVTNATMGCMIFE